MPDFSLVPVDYQPDFGDVSFIPVDYDPFRADSAIQQAQAQLAQTQAQPAQTQIQPAQPQPQPETPPQPLATAAANKSYDPNSPSSVAGSGQASSRDSSSFGNSLLHAAVNAVPGAYHMGLAQQQFRHGNYGAATLYGAESL